MKISANFVEICIRVVVRPNLACITKILFEFNFGLKVNSISF